MKYPIEYRFSQKSLIIESSSKIEEKVNRWFLIPRCKEETDITSPMMINSWNSEDTKVKDKKDK